MNKRGAEFLAKLTALCRQYSAEIGYTNQDDGIHISVGGEEVFVGYLDAETQDGAEFAESIEQAERDVNLTESSTPSPQARES